MAIDIKNLNHAQLNELISRAQSRQTELRKENVSQLRERVYELIRQEGYTFDDIFGTGRPGRPRRSTSTVAPKYRNPANPEQTWSGRGKHPRWFNDALAAGKNESDLAI